MANLTAGLQEKMNALRRVYALELPTKVGELERLFTLFQQDKRETETLKTLQRLSHNLAGSGATFGLPAVSEKAGRLNSLLKTILANPTQATETQLRDISSSLDALKEASLQNLPATAIFYSFHSFYRFSWKKIPPSEKISPCRLATSAIRWNFSAVFQRSSGR